MKRNIGDAERAIRVVVGLAVLSLAWIGPRSAWAWLGLLPLVTGALGWCPPYTLLGISTRREGAARSGRQEPERSARAS